jgi:hypothetical protein
MSISPAFLSSFLCKIILHRFPLISVWLCNFLLKGYWRKNIREINYSKGARDDIFLHYFKKCLLQRGEKPPKIMSGIKS